MFVRYGCFAKKSLKWLAIISLLLCVSLLAGCMSFPSRTPLQSVGMPTQAVAPQVTPSPDSTAEPAITPEPTPTPDIAGQNPLVSSGDTSWRYLDNIADPSAFCGSIPEWNAEEYDDSEWKTMSGGIGAKDGQLEAFNGVIPNTLLNQYQEDGKTNIPAYFFRSGFNLEHAQAVLCLEAQIEYDDAVSVYINGRWAFDANTPMEGYSVDSPYGAVENRGSPARETHYVLNSGILREGWNTVAVELRQSSSDSSDIFFDFISLSALAEVPDSVRKQKTPDGMLLQLGTEPGSLRITWVDDSPDRSQRLFWEETAALTEGAFSAKCIPIAPTITPYKAEGLYAYCAETDHD